mgnify:CR=1 FL=1
MNDYYWDGENWLTVYKINDKILYYFNDKLHRKDGPAVILSDNHRVIKNYFYNGKIHRKDGPALLCISNSGEIIDKKYFYNGLEFDPKLLPFKFPIDDFEKKLYMNLKYGVIND